MEPTATAPSALDDFLFDLNGYLILKNAVSSDLLARLNAAFDEFPDIEPMAWYGNAQRRDYTKETGYELHNVVECGAAFEELIDHPGWIDYVSHYCGEEKSYVQGLFIDEAIASIRRSGGHHPVHSGGFQGAMRGAFGYKNGVFRCGQVNVILALTDVHEGDGPTMVVPGSHKSNMVHPEFLNPKRGEEWQEGKGGSVDGVPGAVEVHMKAGDAIVFVDATSHGSAKRVNPGERKIAVYRYGSSWNRTRWGYHASPEVLARVNPFARKLIHPQEYIRPPGTPTRW